MTIRIKRAYEPPSKSDGARILIDGLWPRGVTKEKAEIAEWMKEVAVSAALRKWFSHDPAKWPSSESGTEPNSRASPARWRGCAKWRARGR